MSPFPPTLRTLAVALGLLVSLAALAATHWLTGEPKATISIQTMAPDAEGRMAPAPRTRFDILRRSVAALLDSVCGVATLRAPEGIVRALEDPGRETFLRGAIECRGFILSPPARAALTTVEAARATFMAHIRTQAYYETLVRAVLHVHGALLPIPRRPPVVSILPSDLLREARLYDPAREELYDALAATDTPGPDAPTYALYKGWIQAVEAYEPKYRRDLLERAIVAAALYRKAAVASAETDTLGRAVFPPVRYGRYWIAGHYPQEPDAVSRAHRRRLLHRTFPAFAPPPLLSWNLPVQVSSFHPAVRLDATNAAPAER